MKEEIALLGDRNWRCDSAGSQKELDSTFQVQPIFTRIGSSIFITPVAILFVFI